MPASLVVNPGAQQVNSVFPLWSLADPIVASYGTAREANGNAGMALETVVIMTFLGYDTADNPVFVFLWNVQPPEYGVPMHDHRDNLDGGFSFCTFHPGTDLPQSPFAV